MDVENRTFDDYGYSYAQVDIPQVDVDGHKLNTDNMYYSIYLGDSTTPFVFENGKLKFVLSTYKDEIYISSSKRHEFLSWYGAHGS